MSKIEIVIVGCGDATNAGGRAHQAIWIKAAGKNFLVDCGATTLCRLQQLGMCTDDLDAILFTHFHGDHFCGVIFIDLELAIVQQRNRNIVYGGPQGIEQQFVSLYGLYYPGFYPKGNFKRCFVEYSPYATYPLFDNVVLSTVPVKHSKESLAYRLQINDKLIAISGDTGWCKELIVVAEDADLFICECEYYRRTKMPVHLSYEQLRDNRKKLTASQILLVHACEEVIQRRNKLMFTLAEDGMRISL